MASPVYDDDGNMTAYKDKSCTWNAENRLVSVETADKKVDYLYDYMGRRVRKQVYAGSPGSWSLESEKQFVYDGWNLVQEIAVSGGSDKYFVWGPDLSQTLQGAGGIGGLLCSVDGGAVRYFLYDANGNVGQLVDAGDGSVAAHYEYDAFGNIVAQSGAYAEGNSFRFSTKYFDEETGFYYYGFRYYFSELGRWGNRDPIDEKAFHFLMKNKILTLNLLSKKVKGNLCLFNLNNPLNFIDYNGLKSVAYCDYEALGFGVFVVSHLKCTIESLACINSRRGSAEYEGLFVGFGVGSPAAKTKFSATFSNSDVRNFSGRAHISMTGVALGPGASFGEICLGNACSVGWGEQGGLDLGADFVEGRGRIGEIHYECCDERAWKD